MTKLEDIVGDYHKFLSEITAEIEAEGFDMSDFAQMDHMCFRTETEEEYLEKKKQLEEVATLLGTAAVNGREISTFRLHEPAVEGDWRVDAVELPAPKEGKPFPSGLEHVELVLLDSIETFLNKYKGKDFELKAVDRGINPEVGLKLDKYSVKFHLLSLTTVVYLENKLGIHEVADGK